MIVIPAKLVLEKLVLDKSGIGERESRVRFGLLLPAYKALFAVAGRPQE